MQCVALDRLGDETIDASVEAGLTGTVEHAGGQRDDRHPCRIGTRSGRALAEVVRSSGRDAGPVVLFLDADLVGLSVEMVQNMTAGVIAGEADMTLGVFRGGQFWTTLAQILVPNISGQRCILRSLFLDVPNVANARYGVELAITNHVLATGVPCSTVILRDVSHPTKELKLGIIRGTIARTNMYIQMVPYMIKRVSSRRKR